ncbi:MAG: sugar ABC transporter ATP-binding protein [Thermoleophilia bacterium]|nr:sugar ABC transporter ATP-binding protein [Thermoleophilia bacterium]
MTAPVLSIEGAVKTYPGVRALDDVSLELRAGEVHALIGENGAGKSTLIKMLSGAEQPDSGQVRMNGEPVQFASPAEARKRGVAAIFQELAIEPWLPVSANVMLGNEPTRGFGLRMLAKGPAEQRTREVLDQLGAQAIRAGEAAGPLSTAQKQLIEIARAIALEAPVIIMDEPTASLPGSDAENLLRIVAGIRDNGGTVVYVSHRLEEVKAIADRVTVLRNGARVHTGPASELSTEQMIELMVGHRVEDLFPAPTSVPAETRLEVKGLCREGAFEDVSFTVKAGEILGVAGLVGAGRSEVMRAISGADPYDSGEMTVDGKTFRPRNPRDGIARGIAYLPEDRKEQGLILSMSCQENIAMATLDRFSPRGFIHKRALRTRTSEVAGRLRLRGNIESDARTLSGGNQQKLVIGKWVMSEAGVLIFDEPTRGIDVGAKPEVYRLMHELAENGAAVIVVSSELTEVMNVSHRLIVMSGGRIRDELNREEFDEHRILNAAFAAHADARV